MHLVIAATENEMKAFNIIDIDRRVPVHQLISGVGPLETAVTVTRFIETHHRSITSVVNFGIGGAYISDQEEQIDLLDICVADKEVLGDFGICYGIRTTPFDKADFPAHAVFNLDKGLLAVAEAALIENNLSPHVGTFVTVNGSSGSTERGEFMRTTYQGICENMEGAAIARVCEEFNLPFLEVRAISNLVEDRPGPKWKIGQASEQAAQAAALIIRKFQKIP